MTRLKRFIAALLCLLLAAGCAADALASGGWQADPYRPYTGDPYYGGDVEYYGRGPNPAPAPGETNPDFPFVDVEVYTKNGADYIDQDFFGEAGKDLVPGDYRVIHVQLVNKSDKAAVIYMKAAARLVNGYREGQGWVDEKDRIDNTGTGDSLRMEPFFPGKTAYDPFLAATYLTMSYDGVIFYRGSLDGVPDPGTDEAPYIVTWHELGEIPAGEERRIEVTLSVDPDIGNDYANRLGTVDWIFMAQEVCEGKPTPTPTTAPTSTPMPSEPPISPTPTPPVSPEPSVTPAPSPTPKPGDVVVVVPPKPPKTGDDQNLWMWIVFAVVALLLMAALCIYENRRHKKQKKNDPHI